MSRNEDTCLFMQRAYPAYADIVECALRENSNFRDLCRDFQQCAIALEHCRTQEGSDNSERICEYEQLLAELAADVERSVEDMR